jgi:hypothetical protein
MRNPMDFDHVYPRIIIGKSHKDPNSPKTNVIPLNERKPKGKESSLLQNLRQQAQKQKKRKI